MTDDEPLNVEPVYLALSRPVMWLGLPIKATLGIAMVAILTLMFANPLWAAVVGGVGFVVARLIVRHEPNAFRLLDLAMWTKWANRDRGRWGGSSYSPLPVAPLKRKGFRW